MSMIRFTFGGGPSDFAITAPSTTAGVVHALAGGVGTLWSAQTGGTQYTDLLALGTDPAPIQTDANGFLYAFQGPFGVPTAWAEFGGGERVLLIGRELANILGPDGGVLDDHLPPTAQAATLAATYGPGGSAGNVLPNPGRLLGRTEFNPATADVKTTSWNAPVYPGSPGDAIRDYSVDFIAPPSGRVRYTASIFIVNNSASVNDYAGLAVIIGSTAALADSKRLLMRRGGASGQTNEGRVFYEYIATGLTSGASYTITLMGYSNGATQISYYSGGSYGPTVLSVFEAAAASTNTTGHVATEAVAPTAIVSDAKYNSFAGVVKCPNGDILGGYRKGSSHTVGGAGAGLYTIRSTDGGATWGTPSIVANDPTYDYGTATLSDIGGGRIALVTWLRPNAGGLPIVNGTRIYISTDNGMTWAAPITVDTGAWLGKYSVSESPLIYFGGAYYIGVWGENAGTPTNSYRAGILRSVDLATWTQVADFYDDGHGSTQSFNEVGVAVVNTSLVAIVRSEMTASMWTSTSADGTTWTTPEIARGASVSAPKAVVSSLYNLAFSRCDSARAATATSPRWTRPGQSDASASCTFPTRSSTGRPSTCRAPPSASCGPVRRPHRMHASTGRRTPPHSAH